MQQKPAHGSALPAKPKGNKLKKAVIFFSVSVVVWFLIYVIMLSGSRGVVQRLTNRFIERVSTLNVSLSPETDEILRLSLTGTTSQLILLEPRILVSISGYKPPDNFTLPGSNVITTLAVMEGHLDAVEQLSVAARSAGYSVTSQLQIDPRHYMTHKNISGAPMITTHFLFVKNNRMVQVAVIYPRGDTYYWIGGVDAANLPQGFSTDGSLFFVPRAFDNFTLHLHHGLIKVPSNPQQLLWELSASEFLECNRTVVEAFFTKNPKTPRTGPRDVAIRKGVRHVKYQMNRLNKRFFLFSGTLLGWYRQCSIIPYTTDMDFGAWVTEYDPSIEAAFKGNKIVRLRYRFGMVNDSLEFQLRGYGIHLDIFFTYKDYNTTFIGGMHVPVARRERLRYTYPMFDVCSCELLGIRLNTPCDSLAMAKAEYGEEWFTPKSKWSTRFPPNVRKNGKWTREQWKYAHQTFDD